MQRKRHFLAFLIPRTLKLRLAVLVTAMLLTGLWTFALVVTKDQEERQRRFLANQQFAHVGYVAEDIDNKVRLRISGLEMIAGRFPLDALPSIERTREFLAERRAIYNLFDGGLMVIKPDGSGAFGDYPPIPERITNRYDTLAPFKDVIASGKSTVGPPRMGRALGKPVVVIAVPVKDGTGALRAILAGVTSLAADQFLDLVVKPRPGTAGDYLIVAPEHGVFVTGTDPRFTLRPLPPRGANAMHDRYMDGYEGSGVASSSSGVEELSSARRIPSTRWFVVERLPVEAAFAPIHEGRRLMFGGATLLTVLITLMTLLALRRELLPLEQASTAIRAMTRGDAPLHPLPVTRHDEIGTLVDSFNHLQEHIALRHAAEQRFAMAFRTSPMPIAIARTRDGRFVEVNDALLDLFERKREDMIGKTSVEVGYWKDNAARDAWLDALTAAGELRNHEVELYTASGARRQVLMSSSFIDFGGEPCIVNFVHDVTEQKRAEQNMRLLAKVFTHSHDGMTITDSDGTVLDVNPAFTELTGYAREEVVGKNPRILQSGRHDKEFYQRMWASLKQDGTWHGEIWNRKKNGALIAEMLTISAVPTDTVDDLRYIGIFTDITRLKQAQANLEQMAHHDLLTGLPNRVLLRDRLLQALAQAKRQEHRLAVCFIDLDGFKPINDTHGHNAGDHLLVEVADRLRGTVRGEDTVARLGGDEFVILVGALRDMAELNIILHRLIEAIAEPCMWHDQPLHISASIGVAIFPSDGADPESLLRRADQAMYAAKRAGRGRFCFYDASDEDLLDA